MTQYHKQPKTKIKGTGGKRRSLRDKILAHYGGFFSRTKVEKTGDKESRESLRTKGGSSKVKGKKIIYAVISKAGTSKKVKVLNVKTSPDNRHYARENILTRGAMIETELGLCRVSSRPGQHGIVNAVYVSDIAPKATGPKAAAAAPAAKA